MALLRKGVFWLVFGIGLAIVAGENYYAVTHGKHIHFTQYTAK